MSSVSHSAELCDVIFINKPHVLFNQETHLKEIPIRLDSQSFHDLESFSKAMTQGMILHPEQSDLFEIYRKLYFGNPNTPLNDETLNTVTQELKKHPELRKPHFKEYEIHHLQRIYDVPESLSKFVNSQIKTAGQIRSNLFQIKANLGYWKKLLNHHDTQIPDNISKAHQKNLIDRAQKQFEDSINQLISGLSRGQIKDLQNNDVIYHTKVILLFKALNKMQEYMGPRGFNNQPIRQAMVDLVHTVGFSNDATVQLLKSKNALEKIEGLKRILDERDTLAMQLGFKNHFNELQANLNIDYPRGYSKNEDPHQIIEQLEKEVLKGSFKSEETEHLRVRSLSIQEAPFRSCVGGSDCSTRTYFSKALDPNFNYFTITDSANRSDGQMTIVLGTAKNHETHKEEPIAFIDKIQNIPNQILPDFLQAVAMSLGEHGYKLGLPESIGDHNGISNMDVTRHFVLQEILPQLQDKLWSFTPHVNSYKFENAYSRAYDSLDIKIIDPQNFNKNLQISAGKSYQPNYAPVNLEKSNLVKSFLKLKTSAEPLDLIKYINSSAVARELEKINLFSLNEFKQDLNHFIESKSLAFNIRKQASVNLFTLEQNINIWFQKLHLFNDVERSQILSEMDQWAHSPQQSLKNNFYLYLMDTQSELFPKGPRENLLGFYKKIQALEELKNPQLVEYLFHYIELGPQMKALTKFHFFEEHEFENSLQYIINSPTSDFLIRKKAFIESLFQMVENNSFNFKLPKFNPSEFVEIASDLDEMRKSHHPRDLKFFDKITDQWNEAAIKGNLKLLKDFRYLELYKPVLKNSSGYSTLVVAALHDQEEVIDWLINDLKINLKSRDHHGFTDLEYIKLLGKAHWAEHIERTQTQTSSRRFNVKERRDDGSPFINFVKVPEGSFKMSKSRVHVTLSRPFELMSVPTTREMWDQVAYMAAEKLPFGKKISTEHTRFVLEDSPVVNRSFEDIDYWIRSLNEVSAVDDPATQQKLKQLFPNHHRGARYRLPTDAEWEYVATLRGITNAEFSFLDKNIDDYACISGNCTSTQPVGLRKPIFILGKPIYDMFGNVWEFTSDGWTSDELLKGGRDPHTSINRSSLLQVVMRGGSFRSLPQESKNSFRKGDRVFIYVMDFGFRLVREL
jgi:formylglycine-generating enzyme required for sulfatase activity